MLNTILHLFKGKSFDEDDLITVLTFLGEMQSALDDVKVGEGIAKHLFRCFLESDAGRLFKGLGSRDKNSTLQILQ